jgi:hypothetical protein
VRSTIRGFAFRKSPWFTLILLYWNRIGAGNRLALFIFSSLDWATLKSFPLSRWSDGTRLRAADPVHAGRGLILICGRDLRKQPQWADARDTLLADSGTESLEPLLRRGSADHRSAASLSKRFRNRAEPTIPPCQTVPPNPFAEAQTTGRQCVVPAPGLNFLWSAE